MLSEQIYQARQGMQVSGGARQCFRRGGAACGVAATCWIRKQMTFILSLAALLKGESVQVIYNEIDQTLFIQLIQESDN